MPVKSLAKVQKHVQKRKGKDAALHPKGRDSARLQRASARSDKIHKSEVLRAKQNQPHLDRVLFMKDVAEEHPDVFTLEEIHVVIQNFIKRDQEEIDQLQAERRPGRPASSRQDLLTQSQANEENEYKSGFWMPNLQDEASLKALCEFSGDWGAMNQLKYVRVAKDGTVKPSAFPPRKEG